MMTSTMKHQIVQPRRINISVRTRPSSFNDFPIQKPAKTRNKRLQKTIHISIGSQSNTPLFNNKCSSNSNIPIVTSIVYESPENYLKTKFDASNQEKKQQETNLFGMKTDVYDQPLHVSNVNSNNNDNKSDLSLPTSENSVVKNPKHLESIDELRSNINSAKSKHEKTTKPRRRLPLLSIILCVCMCTCLLIGIILATTLPFALNKTASKSMESIPISCTNFCAHNGTCSKTGTCICTGNWTGSDCNTPVCTPRCTNNTLCLSPTVCACPNGWSGPNCSIPLCTGGCANNGSCVSPNKCSCATGWNGTSCTNPICTVACTNGTFCSSPGVCACPNSWSGPNCTMPLCIPICQNGGTCTAPNTCSCISTYSGATCTIPVCSPVCSNGGTCSSPGTCTCSSAYTGTRCGTPVCSPTCSNGGTCSAPNTCTCPSTYSGTTCTIPVCSPVCANGGTCSSPGMCTCPSTYTGTRCITPVCSPVCSNGGTCSSPGVCTCPSTYSGTRCTIPVCSPVCSNGGTCSSPGMCTCPSTYTGTRCGTPVCSPVCQNSGTCSSPGTCTCTSGYSGSQCETAPSCFYGKDTVNLFDGGHRSIENLKVGDRIWSLNHHGTQLIEDEIIIMADNGPNKQTLFYTFKTKNGHEVSLTANHNILVYTPINNRIEYLRASKVTIQHQLIMYNRKVNIENISQTIRYGYYSPLTLSNYLLVNNISTSVFSDSYHLSPTDLHRIFGPVRGYYHVMRWLYGKSHDPFASNMTEGVHPLIVWMKYHQTKIRNTYLNLIYIFPLVLCTVNVFELCLKFVK